MPPHKIEIECTAYCSCGYCCNWQWGLKLPGPFFLGFTPSWMPIRLRHRKKGNLDNAKLPIFSKFWTATTQNGSPYYGLTSNGRFPAQARPPILSSLSLMQYQKLPGRLLFSHGDSFQGMGPLLLTQISTPLELACLCLAMAGVEDRGKAIKGPKRIDLYHRSHREALQWGRRKLQVLVVKPGESTLDLLKVPKPVKSVLKGLNWLRGLVF